MTSIFGLLVLIVTHFVDNDVVVVSTVVPSVFIKTLLLALIELLDKASDETLGNEATFLVSFEKLFILFATVDTPKCNLEQFLHICSSSQNGKELFLVHNILENEGRIHGSFVLFDACKLFNQGGNYSLLLFGDLLREIFFKVGVDDMEKTMDYFSNTTGVDMLE